MDNKLTIKNSSIAFLSSFLLCQLGTAIFAVFGLVISSMFGVSNETFFNFIETAIGYLIISLAMDAIIILVFLIANKNKSNKIIKKPTIKKILIYSLLAIVCYLLLCPIVNVINELIYKIGIQPSNLTYKLTTTNYFISIISLVIAPAIAEELLFRGLIFKGLQKGGNTFAIIISALMFSLFHLSLEQTIYPFIMGLVFGVIMCKENNIIYCILVHLLNNFITLTLSYFNISLAFAHWSYYIIATICSIIFIITITLIIKSLNKNCKKEKFNTENKIYFYFCLVVVIIIWISVQISSIL